jgi:hypothetical protein
VRRARKESAVHAVHGSPTLGHTRIARTRIQPNSDPREVRLENRGEPLHAEAETEGGHRDAHQLEPEGAEHRQHQGVGQGGRGPRPAGG